MKCEMCSFCLSLCYFHYVFKHTHKKNAGLQGGMLTFALHCLTGSCWVGDGEGPDRGKTVPSSQLHQGGLSQTGCQGELSAWSCFNLSCLCPDAFRPVTFLCIIDHGVRLQAQPGHNSPRAVWQGSVCPLPGLQHWLWRVCCWLVPLARRLRDHAVMQTLMLWSPEKQSNYWRAILWEKRVVGIWQSCEQSLPCSCITLK